MGNVIITAPRALTGYSLRPFVSGGGGLIHVGIQDVADILSVSENLFGVNVGGGAVGVLTPRTSVRFDLRFFKSVTKGDAENVVVAGPGNQLLARQRRPRDQITRGLSRRNVSTGAHSRRRMAGSEALRSSSGIG